MTDGVPVRDGARPVTGPGPEGRSVEVQGNNNGTINTGDITIGEQRSVEDLLQDRGILTAMLGSSEFTGRTWLREKLAERTTGGSVIVLEADPGWGKSAF